MTKIKIEDITEDDWVNEGHSYPDNMPRDTRS